MPDEEKKEQKYFVIQVDDKGNCGVTKIENITPHELNGIILAMAQKVKRQLEV